MRVAAVFGDKTETVSLLPATLLYKLAARSTPVEIAAEVVQQLEAGKTIDPRAVKAKIAAARLQQLGSPDANVCQETTRAGRAVSPPDDALLGFSAVVLEVIRKTKNQKVTRFAATSIAADELARVAAFLSALANLKKVSEKPDASLRPADCLNSRDREAGGSHAASIGETELASLEDGPISDQVLSSEESTSEAEAGSSQEGLNDDAAVVGPQQDPIEAAGTPAESSGQELAATEREAGQ